MTVTYVTLMQAVLSAFDLKNFNDHDSLLQCGLRLMPLQVTF
jgi:hypothetical protein